MIAIEPNEERRKKESGRTRIVSSSVTSLLGTRDLLLEDAFKWKVGKRDHSPEIKSPLDSFNAATAFSLETEV